jgi:hypothetical protein
MIIDKIWTPRLKRISNKQPMIRHYYIFGHTSHKGIRKYNKPSRYTQRCRRLFVVGDNFDCHGFYYKIAGIGYLDLRREIARKQFPGKLQAVLMCEVANMKTRDLYMWSIIRDARD